jgi:hypothetical protein
MEEEMAKEGTTAASTRAREDPVPCAKCQDDLCNNLAQRYHVGCSFIYCDECYYACVMIFNLH